MDATEPKQVIELIDTKRIMEMIPHRFPFLMIDRVINVTPNLGATGVKNVTANEAQFQGHFPNLPIMPGVLIIEAMAQTSAIVVVATLGQEAEGRAVYFMSVENARFRKPVVPGDTLMVNVEKRARRGGVWKFYAEVRVDKVVVAEGTITAMLTDQRISG
ncbi:MAG: 3-hydroxyacyl-[acyl-carrier-protein] dehydratase FabZ [Rhodospirillaceae bacterium]|nr:3-hydroxyacyl-[acyl-carrier-protein] dehydratase FabZ [Rhodospirillaceae bacterium]|tara:strand:- start:141 stop:620 length:480 start_codon:yes stop_codon:yes gene_type:complete